MDTKQQQIQEWSKVYDRPISDEELTAEINANLNGFFTTLKQWYDDEERMLSKNENDNKRGVLLSSPAK